MNKSQIVDAFNKHFIEFIIDIERVFPNDNDIMSTRKTINKTLVIMPKSIIKMFNENFVQMYGDKIDQGDIGFFIDNNYRKAHGYKDNEQVWALDKIESLRQPVKNMNDDDKQKVIKYLQNLKKLTELYNDCKKKTNK
jgi:hypothetical protein